MPNTGRQPKRESPANYSLTITISEADFTKKYNCNNINVENNIVLYICCNLGFILYL